MLASYNVALSLILHSISMVRKNRFGEEVGEWGIPEHLLDIAVGVQILAIELNNRILPKTPDELRLELGKISVLRYLSRQLAEAGRPQTRREVLSLLESGSVDPGIVAFWLAESIMPTYTPELRALVKGYPGLHDKTLPLVAADDQMGAVVAELGAKVGAKEQELIDCGLIDPEQE